MIAAVSPSVKARMVLVRTLPSEASASTAAAAVSSSGNSVTMTISYSPSVYRCSRALPPRLSINVRKALARLQEGSSRSHSCCRAASGPRSLRSLRSGSACHRITKLTVRVAVHLSASMFTADRAGTPVQLEPIGTAAPRAANAIGLACRHQGQASLTDFSRTDRTGPDYGVCAGHLAGR